MLKERRKSCGPTRVDPNLVTFLTDPKYRLSNTKHLVADRHMPGIQYRADNSCYSSRLKTMPMIISFCFLYSTLTRNCNCCIYMRERKWKLPISIIHSQRTRFFVCEFKSLRITSISCYEYYKFTRKSAGILL